MNSNVLYSLPPYLIIILNRGKGKSFNLFKPNNKIIGINNSFYNSNTIFSLNLKGKKEKEKEKAIDNEEESESDLDNSSFSKKKKSKK